MTSPSLIAVQVSTECVGFVSLPSSVPLYLGPCLDTCFFKSFLNQRRIFKQWPAQTNTTGLSTARLTLVLCLLITSIFI